MSMRHPPTRSAFASIVGVVGLWVAVNSAAGDFVPLPVQPDGTPWPTHAWPESEPRPGVDRGALAAASDELFRKMGRGGIGETRALVVIHGGRIVHERYAEGFSRATPFHSWSMAKSVTQALVGILVRKGILSLDAPVPVPAWAGNGDPRAALTLRNLLHMNTGLDNADGGPDPDDFVARLLFGDWSDDTVRHAEVAPLVHEPGDHWAYSTATSSILAGIVGRSVGNGADDTRAFIRKELEEPLGLTTFVPEFDVAGNYLGGGFVWASARDWARLGMLYLRDGIWDGRRMLPEGWVDFTRTQAPAKNNGTFGAHFWLNIEPTEGQFRPLPGAPESAFQMSGNAGQYVALLPTRDLIVVRLGELQDDDWNTLGAQVGAVTAAFPAIAADESAP